MRYHLRTLLIVLALGPPLLAGVWLKWREWHPVPPSGIVVSPDSAIRIRSFPEEIANKPDPSAPHMQFAPASDDSPP